MRITLVSVLILYFSFLTDNIGQRSNVNFDILQKRILKYVNHYKSEYPNDLKELESFVEDFVVTAPDSTIARSLIEDLLWAP